MTADKKTGTGKVQGEGDYEAARHYDEKLEKFVKDKKSEFPTMAKDAEKAIEGPEGKALREAEAIGKSKARK